ncbi:MAG: hypothetical protein LKE29_03815 [Acidaminococcaceae bacterium]|nr:hypothetical protein [Acidaminococcaceae bacterium]
MKKRLLTGMICAAMALSLVGCGGGAKKSSGGTAAKPKTLKMSVTTAETSVWHVAAKAFKKEVEEKTGRQIQDSDLWQRAIISRRSD